MTTSNKTQKGADDATALVRKSRRYLRVFSAVLALIVLFFVLQTRIPEAVDTELCSESNMNISERNVALTGDEKHLYNLELAKTPTQQELGLSHRPCMPEKSAMLFLFPVDDKFGIWMKEMRFNIDVVWLDKDKKIVTIEKNMKPESYPNKIYYPASDSRYVLEFNDGQVEKLGLKLGQTLNW